MSYVMKAAAGLVVAVVLYSGFAWAGEWAARRFNNRRLAVVVPVALYSGFFFVLPVLVVLWVYATGRLPR